MNYCENSFSQIRYLERLQKQLRDKIKLLPEGTLKKKRGRSKEYYYAQCGDKRISLKNDAKLLEQYILKENLEQQLKRVDHNIPVLERALEHYIPLTPLDSWWESLKSEQNPYKQENRQNLYKGIFYRSKSEVAIAMLLDSYNIPYKYEVEVKTNEDKSRYPDFCIERPKDKKVIYWEHCGLIAQETYKHDLYYKLKEYHSVGIDLWDNLILSFDQYDGGLNTDTIDKLIQMYLL